MKIAMTWYLLVLALFLNCRVSAQTPLTVNYQAVVRNAQTGMPISEQQVYLSFEISEGAGGPTVYSETHPSTSTNKFGLLNVEIGSGQAVSGSMAQVPWGNGNLWLTVSIDVGNGLEILQDSKFASVPYALYARDVANKDDADADPTNELVSTFDYNPTTDALLLVEGDTEHQVNLTPLRDADGDPTNELTDSLNFDMEQGLLSLYQNNGEALSVSLGNFADGDGSPTNELITEFVFNSDNHELIITDNGQAWPVDLSPLVDDADADPSNETISSFYYDSTSAEIVISEAGLDHRLSVYGIDGDLSVTNELVEDLTFNALNNRLTLEQPGTDLEVDLSALAVDEVDDADADPTNELVENLTFNTLDNKLTLAQPGTDLEVDLSALAVDEVDDADADPTNELVEDLAFNSVTNRLTLRQNGNIDFDLNLSPLIDDADASPTNEIQDLSLTGNTLSLSSSVSTVDLAAFDNSALPEGQVFLGNGSGKATPANLSGDIDLANAGEVTVTGLQSKKVASTTPSDGDIFVYNATTETWEPRPKNVIVAVSAISYYSVDPTDFREVRSSTLDDSSRLRFGSNNATMAHLYKGSALMYAPVHLPHGAKILEVTMYTRNAFDLFQVGFELERKEMTYRNLGTEEVPVDAETIFMGKTPVLGVDYNVAPGVRQVPVPDCIVQNERYTYRIKVNLPTNTTEATPTADQIASGISGVIIKYSTN